MDSLVRLCIPGGMVINELVRGMMAEIEEGEGNRFAGSPGGGLRETIKNHLHFYNHICSFFFPMVLYKEIEKNENHRGK